MTISERVSCLEERMKAIDLEVSEIKREQKEANDLARNGEKDRAILTEKLSTLTDNLQKHNEMHEKQNEKKYKITDVVLAIGMLLIAIMQFVGPYIPNKNGYTMSNKTEQVRRP